MERCGVLNEIDHRWIGSSIYVAGYSERPGEACYPQFRASRKFAKVLEGDWAPCADETRGDRFWLYGGACVGPARVSLCERRNSQQDISCLSRRAQGNVDFSW